MDSDRTDDAAHSGEFADVDVQLAWGEAVLKEARATRERLLGAVSHARATRRRLEQWGLKLVP